MTPQHHELALHTLPRTSQPLNPPCFQARPRPRNPPPTHVQLLRVHAAHSRESCSPTLRALQEPRSENTTLLILPCLVVYHRAYPHTLLLIRWHSYVQELEEHVEASSSIKKQLQSEVAAAATALKQEREALAHAQVQSTQIKYSV